MAHSGSWFGLPDFGITEKIGSLFGQQPTYQGGSNLIGPQPQPPVNIYNWEPPATTSTTKTSTTPTYKSTTTNTPTNLVTNNEPSGPSPEEIARQQAEAEAERYRQEVMGQINSGYDSYFGQLDAILNNNLPQQQTAQNEIINSQYNQGQNTLNSQLQTGVYDLNRERERIVNQQNKSLKSLSENLRNMFMTGNNLLGARGAGDSSAVNQYSYALTKLGNKNRGDVMAQSAGYQQEVSDKEWKLKNLYNTELNNLTETKNQQISQVTTWFLEQQNAISQLKATGQLNKSNDLANLSKSLLEQAMNNLTIIDTAYANKKQSLETWAMNNAANINQLKTNMQGISQYTAPNLTYSQMYGQPTVDSSGNFKVPIGYTGYTATDEDYLKKQRGY